jgi:hypothetical protein
MFGWMPSVGSSIKAPLGRAAAPRQRQLLLLPAGQAARPVGFSIR